MGQVSKQNKKKKQQYILETLQYAQGILEIPVTYYKYMAYPGKWKCNPCSINAIALLTYREMLCVKFLSAKP